MEDPQPAVNNHNSNNTNDSEDEETRLRRQRAAEEAMEQMLLAQEAEEEAAAALGEFVDDTQIPNEEFHDEPVLFPNGDERDGGVGQDDPLLMMNGHDNPHNYDDHQHRRKTPSYIQTSFFAAFALIYYALRTRQQWYLALVYLSSRKWAYIVLGNALVASLIAIFQFFTNFFMNGLRLAEAEGLGDFFRWNVTETCLALTMFRSELNIQTGILFLILVLAKCLHWVADMREGHLRMTEEAVIVNPETGRLGLRWSHFRLLLCLVVLQLFDILAVVQCGYDIMNKGPSVSILFAFEGAILLVSVASNITLWHLHAIDGFMHYLHETMGPERSMHRWIHPWKDHKATLVFAVEVQAQAAKFLFYVTFFAIVMTYYGMPINLFREVYMSFNALKQRLVAFSKYRQLMASMNRFATPTEEELAEDSSCIICRDEMTVETTKKLPGCGHLFHKSCLREWLVQQQSCPTCRGDISTMEVRQQQQEQADRERAERQQQQEEEEREEQAGEEDSSERQDQNVQAQATEGSQTPQSQLESPPPTVQNPPSTSSNGDGAPRSTIRFAQDGNDEDGKMPAARSSLSSSIIREKRERTSFPRPRRDDYGENAFPAFYRVVQDQGASVYNNGTTVSFVIREVPFGVIVLGKELVWRECDGASQLMVRMPDGWIKEEELERIVAVPASSQ